MTGDHTHFDWLEVIHPDVALGRVRHALFDFDGTISVIRRGWENVMIPLMVEMITDGYPVPLDLETEVIDYVDRSTGILTIKQMEWLADAVGKNGNLRLVQQALGHRSIMSTVRYTQMPSDALKAALEAV